jgi:hypothetical protein
MSAHHKPADGDLQHCTDEDVTEARVPTDRQRQAITLLGIGTGRRLERYDLATWASVDRIAAALARRNA